MIGPPTGELRVVDDVPGAFASLVGEETERARDHLCAESGDLFTLVLSGGATARLCYEELASSDGIDWTRVHCLLGDERCVPPDGADANQEMIRQVLVSKLPDLACFSPMECSRPEAYDSLVKESLPLALVHLGLGPDGHTASLFPGSAALESPAGALVVRSSDPSGRNPHERLTLTFEAIASSKVAVFTVSGEAKHDALHRLLSGEDIPAARVRAERVVWLCDREALGDDARRLAS